jgi:uncharacterized protein (TIGR03000 family)
MAALTTGSAAPDFCHGGGCWGCSGCYGGCYGYGGCWGGCYGCYGGGWGGCHGGWGGHHRRHGCHGGWGGYYGCCGGWGGCYGSCAGWGCWGCWGGYSSWGYGCYSNGCCGGLAAPALGVPGAVVPAYPTEGAPGAAPGGKSEELGKPKESKPSTMAPGRAKLIVELPADAKLFVDDQPMRTASDVRSFNTPVLEAGQTYYYELRAEVIRDGQPVTATKRVLIRAGEVVRARFDAMQAETLSTAQAK